jgi:protein TonB
MTSAVDTPGLKRWVVCAAVVLGLHAGAAAAVAFWHDPVEGGDTDAAIVVDLAPLAAAPNETQDDIAPGPQQQQSEAPPPDAPPPKPEEKVEAKIEPPPPEVTPEVVLPPEEPVRPPEPPTPVERPPAPVTTAPQRQPRTAALATAPVIAPPTAVQADIRSWHAQIVAMIERHKGYPEDARARGEKGIVQLAFTIDREGRLLASRIVRSSGSASLDQETMATVRRAQPFPAPPAEFPGAKFDFTVPIRFNIR